MVLDAALPQVLTGGLRRRLEAVRVLVVLSTKAGIVMRSHCPRTILVTFNFGKTIPQKKKKNPTSWCHDERRSLSWDLISLLYLSSFGFYFVFPNFILNFC